MNKKKIIHIVNSTIYSGLEKVAIDIIETFKDEYDFYYACKSGPIEEVLKEKNIKRIAIEKISRKELLRIEKEYKPDIIHAHDYTATLFCGLYIKNTPVISHLHNNSPWLKNYFHPYNYLMLKAFKSPQIKSILTVSNTIEQEYIFSKKIKDKIFMIGNPIDRTPILSKVKNEDNHKLYDVCFIGRLTKQKDPLRFIRIIGQSAQKMNNIKAIMLGDGELRDKCQKEIKNLHLEDNISLLGYVKNPYQYLSESKIFCLPSLWEGFGLVAFEALTLGLPCVVSDKGALKKIIDSKAGFVCKSNEDYVSNILELLTDQKYKDFKACAEQRAKELENHKEYMNQIYQIYSNY